MVARPLTRPTNIIDDHVLCVTVAKDTNGTAQFTSVQDAINFAATSSPAPSATTPYTIYIYPGDYNESITSVPFVNLKAIGPKSSVTITQVDGTILTLAANVSYDGIIFVLSAPTGGTILITDNGVACTNVRFWNCEWQISTVTAMAHRVFQFTGNSSVFMDECYCSIGCTGAAYIISAFGGTPTVNITDCNFTFNDTNGFIINSNVASVITISSTRLAGTAALFSVNVGTIQANGGSLIAGGSSSVTGGSVTWKSMQLQYEVCRGMIIQHAIAAAAADTPAPAATIRYNILIHPGTHTETVVAAPFVNLSAAGPRGSVTIRQSDATIFTLASNITIDGVIIQLITPSVGRSMVIDNGAVVTGVTLRNVEFIITTPAALAHTVINLTAASTIVLDSCTCDIAGTGASFFIAASGTPVNITVINSNLSMTNTNAFLFRTTAAIVNVSPIVISNTRLAGTCGPFRIDGGGTRLVMNGGAMVCTNPSSISNGRATCKSGPLEYHVYNGMKIGDAISAASGDTPAPSATRPYTVFVHPGYYGDGLLTATHIYVKGLGSAGVNVGSTEENGNAVVEFGGRVITLADDVILENLTLSIISPAVGDIAISDDGAAVHFAIKRCHFRLNTPGFNAFDFLSLTGASFGVLENVDGFISGAAAGSNVVTSTQATLIFKSCDLSSDNTTGAVLNISGGTVSAKMSDFLNTSTGQSIVCSGGIITLRNCHYHAFTRSGTGNMVDHSEFVNDHIFHTFHMNWEITNANANIRRNTVSGGTITDGGTGQVVLNTNTTNTSLASIANAADAAGSLASTFNPARTPRKIVQMRSSVYQANNTQFFGFRTNMAATAVPAMAEAHAGFIWDGANFKVSCSNAGGVGSSGNIATPSTAIQHTLEIMIYGGVRIEFYVDGVLVQTLTLNLPAVEMGWMNLNVNTGVSGAVTNVTLRRTTCRECPA